MNKVKFDPDFRGCVDTDGAFLHRRPVNLFMTADASRSTENRSR